MQTLAGQCRCNDFNVATRAALVIVGKRRAYGLTHAFDAIATRAHDLLAHILQAQCRIAIARDADIRWRRHLMERMFK